jgi:hypothetical protein
VVLVTPHEKPESRSDPPSATTLRRRFVFGLASLAVAFAGVGALSGRPLVPIFELALVAPGIAIAVLYLDQHRFFTDFRISKQQRRAIVWMLIVTGAAYALALALAVITASPGALVVALAVGVLTGVAASGFLLRALSTGSRSRPHE